MANVWSEFHNNMDEDAIQREIASTNKGGFREVPSGTYHVGVKSMEPKISKSQKPMMSIQFKILDGAYKGSLVFYNQVVDNGRGISNNNDMLRSMELECVDNTEPHIYRNFEQYADLIMDAAEEIDEYGLTFEMYYPGKDGWGDEFKIKEVYEK